MGKEPSERYRHVRVLAEPVHDFVGNAFGELPSMAAFLSLIS